MTLDPKALVFTAIDARRKKSCKGCAFELEHSTVCEVVLTEAKLRAIKNCDDIAENKKGYVYVLAPTNIRQFDMFK